jgi:hypothetical protein
LSTDMSSSAGQEKPDLHVLIIGAGKILCSLQSICNRLT